MRTSRVDTEVKDFAFIGGNNTKKLKKTRYNIQGSQHFTRPPPSCCSTLKAGPDLYTILTIGGGVGGGEFAV